MTRQHGALYRRVQNAGKALGVSDSPWCQCERKPTVSVVWREDNQSRTLSLLSAPSVASL